MAYDSESRLFHDYVPRLSDERAQHARSASTARTWRQLNAATRLKVIEQALATAANDDLPDGFPVAL